METTWTNLPATCSALDGRINARAVDELTHVRHYLRTLLAEEIVGEKPCRIGMRRFVGKTDVIAVAQIYWKSFHVIHRCAFSIPQMNILHVSNTQGHFSRGDALA